jgi:glycosyltransferase involved in cell wall biosynthesis
MHVALLTNRAWLDEELIPFQHLVVGLIDERVRVAQVVPEGVSAEDLSGFGEHVTWSESSVSALNRYRIASMGAQLGDLGIDLIHAVDGRLWRGGLKLAEAMGVPIVLGACSMMDIRLSQRVLVGLDPARVAVTAATEPIAQAIRQHAGPDMLIQAIGTGVHCHDAQTRTPVGEQALCVIVSGNGVLDADYEALLGGIAEFIQRRPASQFFFDGQGGDQHQIWKVASAMNLLGNFSLTPRRLGHREILLKSHALLHPQALGRSRSLTLRAMARGLPIIARRDPYLDYLIDGQTAVVLDDPDPGDWAAELDRLTNGTRAAADLGRTALLWVKQHRPTSHQINGVLDIYHRIMGQTIPFPV